MFLSVGGVARGPCGPFRSVPGLRPGVFALARRPSDAGHPAASPDARDGGSAADLGAGVPRSTAASAMSGGVPARSPARRGRGPSSKGSEAASADRLHLPGTARAGARARRHPRLARPTEVERRAGVAGRVAPVADALAADRPRLAAVPGHPAIPVRRRVSAARAAWAGSGPLPGGIGPCRRATRWWRPSAGSADRRRSPELGERRSRAPRAFAWRPGWGEAPRAAGAESARAPGGLRQAGGVSSTTTRSRTAAPFAWSSAAR